MTLEVRAVCEAARYGHLMNVDRRAEVTSGVLYAAATIVSLWAVTELVRVSTPLLQPCNCELPAGTQYIVDLGARPSSHLALPWLSGALCVAVGAS